MFDCILCLIIHQLSLPIQSQRHLNQQRQPQHQENMLPTALTFPKGKGVIDHYSIVAHEAVFSPGLLPPWAQRKS